MLAGEGGTAQANRFKGAPSARLFFSNAESIQIEGEGGGWKGYGTIAAPGIGMVWLLRDQSGRWTDGTRSGDQLDMANPAWRGVTLSGTRVEFG